MWIVQDLEGEIFIVLRKGREEAMGGCGGWGGEGFGKSG